MTAALKRVFLIGLLSHVLAFSTMFLILSGLTPHGTDYIWCFFLTAIALSVVMYRMAQTDKAGKQKGFLLIGALVVVAGIGWLFLLRPQVTGLDFLLEAFFTICGGVLLRRMILMVADIKYVRQLLLEQYRNDIIAIVLFALLDVLFIGADSSWQRKMLPFFAGFLLTRMIALSLASQLTQQMSKRKTLIEKFQQRTPFFLTAGGLLLLWIVSVTGGPIWMFVLRLLTPIFSGFYYGMSQLATAVSVPGWVKAAIAQLMIWLNEFLCWIAGGLCDGPQSQDIPKAADSKALQFPDQTVSWLWLKILVGVGIVIWLLLYLYRVLRRFSGLRTQEGLLEIREFIQRPTKKGATRTRLTTGTLTPMRKTYRKFLLAMQKVGFVRYEGETANELVAKVAGASPHLQPKLEELTDYYLRERYGDQSVDEQVPRAERLSEELSKRQGKEQQ